MGSSKMVEKSNEKARGGHVKEKRLQVALAGQMDRSDKLALIFRPNSLNRRKRIKKTQRDDILNKEIQANLLQLASSSNYVVSQEEKEKSGTQTELTPATPIAEVPIQEDKAQSVDMQLEEQCDEANRIEEDISH